MAIIAPSLLAADFLNLGAVCKMINNSEAAWYHLDVMDGRFVPNISFGMPIISAIRKETNKILDVHLMIQEPEKYAAKFKEIGADVLTVHVEACNHLHRNIEQIKNLGMKAGVALNPHTPLSSLEEILQDVDLVCIMTVNPGFGGQKFIPHTIEKVRTLKKMIVTQKLSTLIEVDGGVDTTNARALEAAGADVVVAGNAVFGAQDRNATITILKG